MHSLWNKWNQLSFQMWLEKKKKQRISSTPNLLPLKCWLLTSSLKNQSWMSMCENSLKPYEAESSDFCSCSGFLEPPKKSLSLPTLSRVHGALLCSLLKQAVPLKLQMCLCQYSFPSRLQLPVFTEPQQVWLNVEPRERCRKTSVSVRFCVRFEWSYNCDIYCYVPGLILQGVSSQTHQSLLGALHLIQDDHPCERHETLLNLASVFCDVEYCRACLQRHPGSYHGICSAGFKCAKQKARDRDKERWVALNTGRSLELGESNWGNQA